MGPRAGLGDIGKGKKSGPNQNHHWKPRLRPGSRCDLDTMGISWIDNTFRAIITAPLRNAITLGVEEDSEDGRSFRLLGKSIP
jgi:hypothetical protein